MSQKGPRRQPELAPPLVTDERFVQQARRLKGGTGGWQVHVEDGTWPRAIR